MVHYHNSSTQAGVIPDLQLWGNSIEGKEDENESIVLEGNNWKNSEYIAIAKERADRLNRTSILCKIKIF